MGGHVYFRDNLHVHACGLLLEVDELGLGVVAVTGGQSGVGVALEAECGVGAVPVPSEVLLEAVVVEVNLEGVHLVVGHDAGELAQIAHRDVLAAAVHHEAADAVVGPVEDPAAGQFNASGLSVSLQGTVRHLQQGLRSPVHAPGS